MPYGCGEQNMLNFAPDVYILQYLQAIGKSEGSARNSALQYINYGWRLNVDIFIKVELSITVSVCFLGMSLADVTRLKPPYC
jgi:hypothetical protein